MLWLPLCSLACLLMYQGTNAGVYYLVGTGVYFWGFVEGEVCYLSCSFSLNLLLHFLSGEGFG